MTIKIPDKKLLGLYCKMLARLNDEYPKRFWNWLSIFQRALDKEITEADDNIGDIWEKCNEGSATLMAFLGGLKIYEQLVLRGYGLYNAAQNKLEKQRG